MKSLTQLILLPLVAATMPLHAATLPRMHPGSPWYQRIDQAAVHPNSGGPGGMIATLSGLGGFGNGRMQIDFGMHVLYASGGTSTQPIIEIPSANPDDDYYLPDCEPLATPMPLPAGAPSRVKPATAVMCSAMTATCWSFPATRSSRSTGRM